MLEMCKSANKSVKKGKSTINSP